MADSGRKSQILITCQVPSTRVKGLSFHPKRPWILAALRNGEIQLWDYRMQTIIERFEEHEGMVRGIDFHPNQPMFVSGGDDMKVRVWNYRLRRCIFVLTGHADYVRTVEFHKVRPWIVSASDDFTLRIWNWQSRSEMSVLQGHGAYVMSASFHSTRQYVVSASMDHTIRLWDISALEGQPGRPNFKRGVEDIFGSSEVQVKSNVEGHDRGVNYASFHPTLPRVVSGADDKTIRIWQIEEMRTYETEKFTGHHNNVTCVKYFKDLVVSASEDGTCRVWEVKNSVRTAIHVIPRDNDRFWTLAVHPEKNLIAAGHDSGMIIFKLERERPAMQLLGNTLYWVNKRRQLKSHDFDKNNTYLLLQLSNNQTHPPHTLSYSKDSDQCVFYYPQEGGMYELYNIGKGDAQATTDFRRDFYHNAVFFQKNHFATLDRARQIVIRNGQNAGVKTMKPVANADEIHWAPGGDLLLRSDDKVFLYNTHRQCVTAEASVARVKYVVWSPERAQDAKVALLSKHGITVLLKRGLKNVCTLRENSRVKSACFDETATVLFYCTMNHLKYCLRNGDTGTIMTLDAPIYLVRVVGDEVTYLDREANLNTKKMDSAEYRFKLALLTDRWSDVLKILKTARFHGRALVCYLQERGYPEVAMHFVKDQKVRFQLAVDCGNIDDAFECAEHLKDAEAWSTLARAATGYGMVNKAAKCLAKAGELQKAGSRAVTQKLAFTNFLLGDVEKARDFADMARDDANHRFQIGLFTGDVDTRLKLLEDAGQFTLAHQVALRHGLADKAAALLRKAGDAVQEAMAMPAPDEEDEEDEPEALTQARQVAAMKGKEAGFATAQRLADTVAGPRLELPQGQADTSDWPLRALEVSKVKALLASGENLHAEETVAVDGEGDWDDNLDIDDDDDPFAEGPAAGGAAGGGEGDGFDVDLDLGGENLWDDNDIEITADDVKGAVSALPPPAAGLVGSWSNSRYVTEAVAAGAYETAMKLLKGQEGIYSFDPLRPYFHQCFLAANGSLLLPSHLPQRVLPQAKDRIPLRGLTLPVLQERAKAGAAYFEAGKFSESLQAFQAILHMKPLLALDDEKEIKLRDELVRKARTYASGCSLQLKRKDTADVKKLAEMACYFTHYDLDHQHQQRVTDQAMVETYKKGFYRTAAHFAQSLLSYTQDPRLVMKAKKVLSAAETSSDARQLDYDPRAPFETCVATWTPMYQGKTTPIDCSYCGAFAQPTQDGENCPVCKLGRFRKRS